MVKLPELGYEFNSLEPFIDSQTMELHYSKHHAGYVDKLNKALEIHSELQDKTAEELLSDVDSIPEDIRQSVINNAGGHVNHSLFWKTLRVNNGEGPKGDMLSALESEFGSFDEFKKQFSEKTMNLFGSGWVFLIKDSSGKLRIKRHSFQNSPIMDGNTPLLGLDVWEHAYYLKYQNRRQEYVDSFWNIVNWTEVENLFVK